MSANGLPAIAPGLLAGKTAWITGGGGGLGGAVEVALGEFLLDVRLAFQQPVHGLIQIVLGGVGDLEFFGQGGGVPEPGGGELGAGVQEAFGDHGQHQVALARGLGGEQGLQAEAAHHAEHGLNVAVRQVAFDSEGL